MKKVNTTKANTTRKEGLDKFYTTASTVDKCISSISTIYNWENFAQIIEPSAGNGSFLTKIPSEKKIGIDISPEHENITKQDFFEYLPKLSENKEDITNVNSDKILVIGNPPFGKVSSLAIRFFNHAAEWATTIAFIIPRTFRRISVQNKLNKSFHLILDEEIATSPCSFSPPMMVKCCFQIWEKRDVERESIKLATKHNDWIFLQFGPNDVNGQPTPPSGADFAIRAYGGKCGEIKKEKQELEILRPKSWHWIKCNEQSNINISKEQLMERFANLDYSNSLNTARQNSMGRGELVSLYSDYIMNAEL